MSMWRESREWKGEEGKGAEARREERKNMVSFIV